MSSLYIFLHFKILNKYELHFKRHHCCSLFYWVFFPGFYIYFLILVRFIPQPFMNTTVKMHHAGRCNGEEQRKSNADTLTAAVSKMSSMHKNIKLFFFHLKSC